MITGIDKHNDRLQYKVHNAVIDVLRQFGIDTIFGNPGSTELGLFLDFPEDFRYILGLQESVAVGMADGYAQAVGNAACVNLHSAVGVGHAMGAIFTAYKNHTPMIVTAGQQSRSILPFDPFLFSKQATELPKPYVKWSIEPARAEDVPRAMARAYYIAMQPPCGPVLVSIPADDWNQYCEPISPLRKIGKSVGADSAVLQQIADLLNNSAKPAFILGADVDRDGAWNEIIDLAERHKASVWIAPKSGRNSFPEDHRLFSGFLPPMREQIVEALSDNDFILVLGAPAFAYHVEGNGPHIPPESILAQISEDPEVLSWTDSGIAAIGSMRQSILDLIKLSNVKHVRETPPARQLPSQPTIDGSITPELVFSLVSKVRDPESVVVEESTSTRSVMQQHLSIVKPNTFFAAASGGLGFGLPASVGIALGRPDKKVICLIGDGSSMYSVQALWSAAQLDLDISFIVLRNSSYKALKNFAPVYGFKKNDPLYGLDLPNLDFVTIAQGMGCYATRVRDAETLELEIEKILKVKGASVLEIIVG